MTSKLTSGRKSAFLEALRNTGSIRAAARLASPGRMNGEGPHSTFRMAMKRDPLFAAAAQEAQDDALGSLEAEAMRRARDGYQRPVYQKGELVGYDTVYSDQMLLTLLRARAPETYSERRDVNVTGNIAHAHNILSITAADLVLLSDSDRASLVGVVERLSIAKGEPSDGEPTTIEHGHD